ncbi:unnamed protein product [Phytophthora fragariaefolia]|uniref:Unnamed protein product n=1 Tax=Phytophthora fragariaefolia TaxID=1490495 RepID=A0A9W7DET0_9STRA|nr:unnamed protein product [Phytophthora fragariaefolia]
MNTAQHDSCKARQIPSRASIGTAADGHALAMRQAAFAAKSGPPPVRQFCWVSSMWQLATASGPPVSSGGRILGVWCVGGCNPKSEVSYLMLKCEDRVEVVYTLKSVYISLYTPGDLWQRSNSPC